MNANIRRGLALVGVVASSVATSAHAALPTGISDAITGASTDGLTLVGLLAAAGAAVFLIAKLLKRFGVSF